MSQTNGQYDEFVLNGPNSTFQASFQSSNNSSTDQTELTPPTGPPISDFLTQLSDYNSTIPGELNILYCHPASDHLPLDTVTAHYLASSGLETSDPRIVKLVSLAAQKFVSDVAADALNHCKMRQQRSINMVHSTLPKRKDKYVMTTEDLSQALGEQGVSVKKPPYYQ